MPTLKLMKIIPSMVMIFMVLSSSFSTVFLSAKTVFALSASCKSVREEEFRKYPSVIYCSKPIEIYNYDGSDPRVETFESTICEGSFPTSCDTSSLETYEDVFDDGINSIYFDGFSCVVTAVDTGYTDLIGGYYNPAYIHIRNVTTLCSNQQNSVSWSGWEYRNGRVETFHSPDCPDNTFAIACLTKSAVSDNEDLYGEDVINSIFIKEGERRCTVIAIDTQGNYEHNRTVGVVCSKQEPNIRWGNWVGDYMGETFQSPPCPSGHPIACLTEAHPKEFTEDPSPDIAVDSLYIKDNICEVKIHDFGDFFYYNRRVGVVCSNEKIVETHSNEWNERNQEHLENLYFAYSNLPNNENYVQLYSSLVPKPLEPLHHTNDIPPKDVANWDGNKIIVNGNGSFIIHEKPSDVIGRFFLGSLSLSRVDEDAKILLNPVQDCKGLVLQMTMLSLQALFPTLTNVTQFGEFAGIGINTAWFSMLKLHEGSNIPLNWESILASYARSKGDSFGLAVILVKDRQFKKLIDLPGEVITVDTRPLPLNAMIPNDQATPILNDIYSGRYGVFDDIIVLVYEPPNTAYYNSILNNGIEPIRYTDPLPSHSLLYETYYRNLIGRGTDVTLMRLTAPSIDDINNGEVMWGFYTIRNPGTYSSRLLYTLPPFLLYGPPPPGVVRVRITVGYDPRAQEIAGVFSRQWTTVNPDGSITFSTIPPGTIVDMSRVSLDHYFSSLVLETFASSVNTIFNYYTLERTPLELESATVSLERIQRLIADILSSIHFSELPQEIREEYFQLVNMIGVMNRRILDSNFDESLWDDFISRVGEIYSRLNERTFSRIEAATNAAVELQNRGRSVSGEAQEIAQSYGRYVSESADELTSVTRSPYTRRVSETVGGIPKEVTSPEKSAWNKYGKIILGFAVSFLTSLGPYIAYWGRLHDNSLLVIAGYTLQFTGYGLAVYYFYNLGMRLYSLWHLGKTIFLTGLFGSLTLFAVGFILGYLTDILIRGVYCLLNPNDPACGCSIDNPFYENVNLKLESHAVKKNENLTYAVYGVHNCLLSYLYPFSFSFYGDGLFYDKPEIKYTEIPGIGPIPYYVPQVGSTSECHTVDGRCFDCTVNVTQLEEGKVYYKINAGILRYGHLGWEGGHSDFQILKVCDSAHIPDKSSGKCVLCDILHKDYSADFGDVADDKCEEACGASIECDEKEPTFRKGYEDDEKPIPRGVGPISANQIRACEGCWYRVTYDSYLTEVSVNGITYGDVTVNEDEDIRVTVKFNNTGTKPQEAWFVGVEFWKVPDYKKIGPGADWDPYRTKRVNAYYNNKDKTHGCVENPDPLNAQPSQCPSNVDCNIIEETKPDSNHNLDPGETITLMCHAPASFYSSTSEDERIMFWIHERDLSQDATNNGDPDNDGIISEWWIDALAKSFRLSTDNPVDGGPADVRVRIKGCNPDGSMAGICRVKCEASPECDGKNPNTGCCSGCYYVDIDNNSKIDIKDIFTVARAFGTKGSRNWDASCDITGPEGKPDGKVSVHDLEYCAKAVESEYKKECDLNKDGKVNETDMEILAKANGSWGDKRYDPKVDVNKDGTINIIDISMVARKFGQEC